MNMNSMMATSGNKTTYEHILSEFDTEKGTTETFITDCVPNTIS